MFEQKVGFRSIEAPDAYLTHTHAFLLLERISLALKMCTKIHEMGYGNE